MLNWFERREPDRCQKTKRSLVRYLVAGRTAIAEVFLHLTMENSIADVGRIVQDVAMGRSQRAVPQ